MRRSLTHFRDHGFHFGVLRGRFCSLASIVRKISLQSTAAAFVVLCHMHSFYVISSTPPPIQHHIGLEPLLKSHLIFFFKQPHVAIFTNLLQKIRVFPKKIVKSHVRTRIRASDSEDKNKLNATSENILLQCEDVTLLMPAGQMPFDLHSFNPVADSC